MCNVFITNSMNYTKYNWYCRPSNNKERTISLTQYFTGCINVKHPVVVSTHYQIWWWEEAQLPAVGENGEMFLANILLIFSSMKHLLYIKFSVSKTRICNKQSGLHFVDLTLFQSCQKLHCLEEFKGELSYCTHTHTLQCPNGNMIINARTR